MADLQPIPSYAMPFLGNEEALKQLELRFNPQWLKWFLDTFKQLTSGELISHQTLQNLQGGDVDERWHLTEAQAQFFTNTIAQKLVYAGPVSGAAAVPTFRALAFTDFPALTDGHLLGRAGGANPVEAIVVGANLSLGAGVLSAAGGVSGSYNFDGTASGTVSAMTITNGRITAVTVRP